MLNAIKSELYKARKNKIFYVCSAIVIFAALYGFFKYTVISPAPENSAGWIQIISTITALPLSIASGFVITFLIQREYDDKTIINVLSAPTSRVAFIFSKLAVWTMWYILMLAACTIIYFIAGNIIYHENFSSSDTKLLFEMIVKTRLLSFIASTPILLVAVMQRRTFYPTLMCSLAFAGIELFSMMLPVKFSTLIPWTAAVMTGYNLTREFMFRALISVFAAGIFGIISACAVFKKQNQ